MNWKINTLEYTNDSDKGVINAHWDVTLTDEDYSARRYGSCSFSPDPSSDEYVPFESLTEELVIGWVKDTLDVEQIEKSLTVQIEEQKNPKTLKGLAWD
jgi:hypothetical protein